MVEICLRKMCDLFHQKIGFLSTWFFFGSRMDSCQESIESLSDDIQRLQACLADEELKAEEDTVEETRWQNVFEFWRQK